MNNKTRKNFFTPSRHYPPTACDKQSGQLLAWVKNRLFTLHQLITTYLYDTKKKNHEVNSVNSNMEKKNFTAVDENSRASSD